MSGVACFGQAALEQRWEGRVREKKRQGKREEGQSKKAPIPHLTKNAGLPLFPLSPSFIKADVFVKFLNSK